MSDSGDTIVSLYIEVHTKQGQNMASRPQIQDNLRRRLKLVTGSHFAVPEERVSHSDRIETLLTERKRRKKRIEELREFQIEETIYNNHDQVDLGVDR